jgi:hypothetical protein
MFKKLFSLLGVNKKDTNNLVELFPELNNPKAFTKEQLILIGNMVKSGDLDGVKIIIEEVTRRRINDVLEDLSKIKDV